MKRTILAATLALATAVPAALAHAQSNAPMKVTLAGGSVGGAWSVAGNAIGETLRREYPNTSFTYEPGREQSNILLVSQGRVQLGIAHAQLAGRALSGGEPFKQPVTNIRAIAVIDPLAAMQVFARQGSDFQSFEQVRRDKKPIRVALNQRGTMMALAGEELLAAKGIPAKDIEAWGGKVHYVAYNEGLEMMKNKQVDLIVNLLAFPSGQVASATREMPVQMVGLTPEVQGALQKSLGMMPIEVPAKTYDFQPAAVPSATATVVLVANASMSDEDAGKIVSAMLKNMDFLKQSHAMMRQLDPAALARVAPLTLHPGAEKAYRAAGALK
ncbi:MAG: TAXI family TRAP transporter solute-binding subunit [Betaproteobacteria bacterium]|nr:TAXI family TRAP transporter solute-binding subunit [Betaproteobacteria bacterium]